MQDKKCSYTLVLTIKEFTNWLYEKDLTQNESGLLRY